MTTVYYFIKKIFNHERINKHHIRVQYNLVENQPIITYFVRKSYKL